MLQSLCSQARFEPGDALREQGQHYSDMYLIKEGSVDVIREQGTRSEKRIVSDPGSPIGEIGFLRGCSATATVTARTPVTALVIDDPTLARFESEQPSLAADLLRCLADIAEERRSFNLVFTTTQARSRPHAIEVYLCRNKDMLESVQRLRYEVYCQELGRQSPNADHEKRIITDDLDDFAKTFVAVEAGETIGTLRGNKPADGFLGIIEELYGMKKSAHHPDATSICTKFIVKKSKRGGPASMKLISAMVRYGLRNGVKECYIDCVPALLHYYKAIGFTIAGERFFHRENGPSYPMLIDLMKHGEKLSHEAGVREYLSLIVKAHAIRLRDRFYGHMSRERSG